MCKQAMNHTALTVERMEDSSEPLPPNSFRILDVIVEHSVLTERDRRHRISHCVIHYIVASNSEQGQEGRCAGSDVLKQRGYRAQWKYQHANEAFPDRGAQAAVQV